MSKKADMIIENSQTQLRKGALELVVLLSIKQGDVYTGDILELLKKSELIIVEGTLYPLLSRLKRNGLVEYTWQESVSGPPRKYYSLTPSGRTVLEGMITNWKKLNRSILSLNKTKK